MATPLRRLRVRADFGHGRKQANADVWLTALETRYAEHKVATGRIVSAMAHDASNEGRSQATEHGLVNGTEVRWSERWLQPTDPTQDYETVWSIMPDGTRRKFEVPQAESKPRTVPLTDAELRTLDNALRAAQARESLHLPTQADVD